MIVMLLHRLRMLRRLGAGAIVLAALAQAAGAQPESERADEHAPIAVLGDHYHEAGELMVSYRYTKMSMQGNADGTHGVRPADLVTTVPNRFFGQPMQPPTLRVVPSKMTTDMHMLGLMFAPSDRITVAAKASYVKKATSHVTYAGPAGTEQLGTFETRTSGIGDTSMTALVRLFESSLARLHLSAGLSVPTGDTNESGGVLVPTGMRPTLRLPYPMQLGSGTYDWIAGLTYARFASRSSWGAQWRSVLRSGENDEGYTFGDEHRLTAWYSGLIVPRFAWSARAEVYERGNVDGIDPSIVAPVQTADPERQGATRMAVGIGLNYAAEGGHRVGFEYVVPVRQDLDGPQLETESMLTLGYQFSF